MLNFIKQNKATLALAALALVAALSFRWYRHAKAPAKVAAKPVCVARVQSKCIDAKDYRATRRVLTARGAGNMKDEMLKRLVLDGLVQRQLLIGEAEGAGVSASDDEVTSNIEKGILYVSLPVGAPFRGGNVVDVYGRAEAEELIPGGFKNPETKQFDQTVYESALEQHVGCSPDEFRAWQARELVAAKMRERSKPDASEEEALEYFLESQNTATIDYVLVRRDWTKKHAVKEPTDAEVNAWGKANPTKVLVPVRHILVLASDKTQTDQVEEARARAEELLARVKKGEDFEALAKEFSDDPLAKENGGKYAAEKVPGFVLEFRESVARLKPGQVDENVVESGFGFHIIKREPATPEDVRASFVNEKANAAALVVAQDIHARMTAGESPEDAIQAAVAEYKKRAPNGSAVADDDPDRPRWLTSERFHSKTPAMPKLGADANASIATFAFASKPNAIAAPILDPYAGAIVARLKERKEVGKEDFEKVRDSYIEKVKGLKAAGELQAALEHLLAPVKDDIKVFEQNLVMDDGPGDGG